MLMCVTMPLTSEALSGRESGTLAVTIEESLENKCNQHVWCPKLLYLVYVK